MKRVLIVDDSADLRRLVRWSLEILEGGVELHECAQADEGLARALDLRPALVLLDVMTPGPLDGLQVCRALRASEPMRGTRIVLMSARGQAADVEAGVAAGADVYLVKPFSPQHLLDTVEGLLAALPCKDPIE